MTWYSNNPPDFPLSQLHVEKLNIAEPHIQQWEVSDHGSLISPPVPAFRGKFYQGNVGRVRNCMVNCWLWEIICSSVSVIFLVATFAFLSYVNNMPYNDWTLPWRINSVIALLMTILKAAMLVPITAGLGQLKWLWFSNQTQRRRLEDMDKFDRASRGSAGSLMLLATLRFR